MAEMERLEHLLIPEPPKRTVRDMLPYILIVISVTAFTTLVLLSYMTSRANCHRDQVVVTQLRSIIDSGRDDTKKFYQEGTISKAQYERSIRSTNHALAKLKVPACSAFSQGN